MGDSGDGVTPSPKPPPRRMKPAPSMTTLPSPSATSWDLMNDDGNTDFTDRRVSFDIDKYGHFDHQQSPQETMSAGQSLAHPTTSKSPSAGTPIPEDDGDASSSMAGSTLETFEANDDLERLLPEEPDSQPSEWDVFGQYPLDNELDMESCWVVTLYICKFLTCIFLLIMVFGGATISIGTVVFAAGNMRQSQSQNLTGHETPTYAKYSILECIDYTKTVKTTTATTTRMTNVSGLSVAKSAEYGSDQTDSTTATVLTSGDYVHCLVLPRGWPKNKTHEETCLKLDDNEIAQSDVYHTQMCDTVGIQWVWCLFLIIVTPYAFVFFRCLWMVMFRQKKWPDRYALAVALLVDTLYVTGVCMLAFVVLPLLDNVIQMAMVMMGVGLTPAIMLFVQRFLNKEFYSQENERNDEVQDTKLFILRLSLDIFALLCQIIGLITWPIYILLQSDEHAGQEHLVWSVPVSLFLISLGYWENYVDLAPHKRKKTSELGRILQVRRRIRQDFGVKLRLITSFWKMVVALAMTVAFVPVHEKVTAKQLFSRDTSGCDSTISHDDISSLELDWVWVWLINAGSALVCYFGARTAAKIQVQLISYALPLFLATPLAMVFLGLGCDSWTDDPCSYVPGLPSYVFFRCQDNKEDWWTDHQIWLIIVWTLSQLWLTWHIWWQKNERLASSEK